MGMGFKKTEEGEMVERQGHSRGSCTSAAASPSNLLHPTTLSHYCLPFSPWTSNHELPAAALPLTTTTTTTYFPHLPLLWFKLVSRASNCGTLLQEKKVRSVDLSSTRFFSFLYIHIKWFPAMLGLWRSHLIAGLTNPRDQPTWTCPVN